MIGKERRRLVLDHGRRPAARQLAVAVPRRWGGRMVWEVIELLVQSVSPKRLMLGILSHNGVPLDVLLLRRRFRVRLRAHRVLHVRRVRVR